MITRDALEGANRDSTSESDGEMSHDAVESEDYEVNACSAPHLPCSSTGDMTQGSSSDSDNNGHTWNNIDQFMHPILSTDSENDKSDVDDVSLASHLRDWVNKFQVKHNAVDELVKLLRESGHPDLPATARTLLKTARTVDVSQKSGMEYIFLGVKVELVKHLDKYPPEIRQSVNTLDIALNIDGLPLFSSTKKSLWPVLCAIQLVPMKIFPVALSYGASKPSDLDFLRDTITELQELLQNGFRYQDRVVQIKLKCIVCDAPAKAMVKAIKMYSGYHGCDKCCQRGAWEGRLVYPEVQDLEMRTNESFRDQAQAEHHRGVTPLCDLPVDMITLFPIDYMHQACLGVMKRLLLLWLRGKREVRMSSLHCDLINKRLVDLRNYIPASFARKPRSLLELEYWKATEYRQFLLYTGRVVLKGVLRQDLYAHFLCLSTAISLLVCPRLAQQHAGYAQELLEYFVDQGRQLYGPEFLVYNVHTMVHLAANVQEFTCLDSCSAFPFENYLHQLKRLIRSGKNPIAQIIKRLGEMNTHDTIMRQSNTSLKVHPPNNAFITASGQCCEVVAITKDVGQMEDKEVMCRVFHRAEPLFSEPCNSSIVGAFRVHIRHARMQIRPARSLVRRAIMIQHQDSTQAIFMAILHEY